MGQTCAGPSFERLPIERLSFEKYEKTVFQKTVLRSLELLQCGDINVAACRRSFKIQHESETPSLAFSE